MRGVVICLPKSMHAMFVNQRMVLYAHPESDPGFILLNDSESTAFLIMDMSVGKAAMAVSHSMSHQLSGPDTYV